MSRLHHLLASTLLLAATACSGSDDVYTPPFEPSCMEPAAVDPAGVQSTWVVDSVDLASTSSEAFELGLDLDCDPDGKPSNALGQALAAVYNFESTDLDTEVNAMVTSGKILHLLQLRATSLEDANGVGVTLLHGLDTDGDPTDNFGGDETFAVDSSRGRGTMSGFVLGGHLQGRGEQIPVGLGLPGFDEIVVLPLAGARIDADIRADRIVGRIGGAIPADAIDLILIPFVERALDHVVARDCPEGVCASGSFGDTVLGVFDTDHDGDISVAELRDSTLISALLRPDVDLFDADGRLGPPTDGVYDALSIGLGFTAVPAAVDP